MIPSIYQRTDLALEDLNLEKSLSGVSIHKKTHDSIHITTVEIHSPDAANELKRPIGNYITLEFSPFWMDNDQETRLSLIQSLTKLLTSLLTKEKKPHRILVAGLGNRAITADAIGPLCADRIEVTGHYHTEEALRPYLPPCPAYAISPGVVGNTGIETQKLIQAALSASNTSHVIVIDSLAARSTSRLGNCIQLTDSGITPGSGIGNCRAALNKQTLGVPTIAIGVPLVVSSSTLVYDALEKAGIKTIDPDLQKVLENGKDFFVTLNESDLATLRLAELIAEAINTCISQIT